MGMEMNKTKVIILVSILLVISVCLSGCACAACIPQGAKANMLMTYMNNKYKDDHFELEERHTTGGAGFPNLANTRIYCSSEKYPNATVKALYLGDENKYEDNYLGIKYAKQLDEHVENYAKELFPNHNIKIYATSDDIGNIHELDLPADTSFEDYIKNGREYILFYCEYNPEEFEKDKAEIEKRVVESVKTLDMNVIRIDIKFTKDVNRDKKDIKNDTYNSLYISFELDDNHNSSNVIKSVTWDK